MHLGSFLGKSGFISALLMWTAGVSAQSTSLIDLGPGVTAYGINALGQVTGCFSASGGTTHAFLYGNGAFLDLGTLGGSTSCGFALNNGGQVTGYAATGGGAIHAFRYAGGVMQDLGTLSGISTSIGTSINSSGDVVGYAWNGTPYSLVDLFTLTGLAYRSDTYGFEFSGGILTELLPMPSMGIFGYYGIVTSSINDNGVVAGFQQAQCTTVCPVAYPFILQNGSEIILGDVLDWVAPTAISATGTVVGYGEDSDAFMHGVLYINGVFTDLGLNTEAFAVNNSGTTVGISNAPRQAPTTAPIGPNASPFVYANGVFTTLPVPGGIPTGINDNGTVIINQPALNHAYLYGTSSVTLAPNSIDFGSISLGNTNPPCGGCTVTLTNDSASAIPIGIISATLPFSQTNNCTASLAPAASCTINVSFKPAALGAALGQLVVPANSLTYAVILSGTGNIELTLSASTTTTQIGVPFTLSWAATAGSSCVASGGAASAGGNDGWMGMLAASGSITISESVASSYTYVLTCTSGALSSKQEVSVNVSPARHQGGGGSIQSLFVAILLLPAVLAKIHRAHFVAKRPAS